MTFFFQAEDGIRDKLVTGVQTCALPISRAVRRVRPQTQGRAGVREVPGAARLHPEPQGMEPSREMKRGVDYIGVMLRDRLVRPRPGPTGADRDQPREPRELR